MPSPESRRSQVLALVVFLVAVFVAAAVGSLATTSSLDPWYAGLNKPSWTPSGTLIGIVWSILYPLMGIAAWLVWRQLGWTLSLPLLLFASQLVVNVLWSVVFFGLQSPVVGFVLIVILWAMILATLIAFWRISRWAGGLFVPYIVWVTIAGTLNFLLWQMNP